MARLSQETILRLQNMQKSDKFKTLSPETQQRFSSILASEITPEQPTPELAQPFGTFVTGGPSDPFKSKRRGITTTGDLILKTIGDPGIERLAEKGEQFRRKVVAPAAKLISTRFLGLPEAILRKVDPETAERLFPEPIGTTEKVLQFGGEAAGFAKGLALKAGTGIVNMLSKLGLKKGTRLAQAIELGTAAGIQTPEGEDIIAPGKRVGAAVIGTTIGAVLPRVKAPKPKTAIPTKKQKAAGKLVNVLIRPNQKQFSYGKDPGTAVAMEGIVANNLDDLTIKISDRTNDVGAKIINHLRQFENTTAIDFKGALNPLNVALARASKAPQTNKALINRIQNAKNDLLSLIPEQKIVKESITTGKIIEEIIPKGKGLIVPGEITISQIPKRIGERIKRIGEPKKLLPGQKIPKEVKEDFITIEAFLTKKEIRTNIVTPLKAFEIKQTIGDITKWTADHTEDTVINGALKKVYGNVKGAMNSEIPGLAPLNERYANLITAKVASQSQSLAAGKRAALGFSDTVAGVSGALLSIAKTGADAPLDAIPIILTTASFTLINKAMRSTAVKTRLASWLAKQPKSKINALMERSPALKQTIDKSFGSVDNLIKGVGLTVGEGVKQ